MNTIKETYERPTTELLEIRLEGNLLTLSTQGNTIDNGTIDPWGDEL